jgi:hypothetical protein
MSIGDLWLGNRRSKIKDDVSVLKKVTCNLFLGRNVTSYIRYSLLNVTVPLQLLVTAILEVTKPLLVTLKSN